MLFERGRNDICHCGSRKKYKRCCLDKNDHTMSSESSGQSFKVTIAYHYDDIAHHEIHDGREALDASDTSLFHSLEMQLACSTSDQIKKDSSVLDNINKLHHKYPQHPVIFRMLIIFYETIENCDQASKLFERMLVQYPRYFLGKLNAAHSLLDDGNIDASFYVLRYATTLQEACPNRTEFHIHEIVKFYSFLVRYHAKKYQKEKAEEFYTILKTYMSTGADALCDQYTREARTSLEGLSFLQIFSDFCNK